MMVKKPTAKASTAPEDTSGDFFKELKKKKKIVKSAANEEASSGFTNNFELGEALELRDKQNITTKARCMNVRVAKLDNEKESMVANFTYAILSGKGKGLAPSKSVWFDPQGEEDEDEAFARAMKDIWFEIQHLGYETKGKDDEDLKEMIEEINKDKPTVMLKIRGSKSKRGENKGKIGGYVNAMRPIELDEDDEDDEEEETEEEEEDVKKSKEKSSSKTGSKSSKKKEEEEEEDEPEEDEEEEEEEEPQPDEDDPSTWVGWSVKYKAPKAKKAVVCVVENYARKGKVLTLKDEKNDETYKVKADDEGILGFA
jgi:hypothetical protein